PAISGWFHQSTGMVPARWLPCVPRQELRIIGVRLELLRNRIRTTHCTHGQRMPQGFLWEVIFTRRSNCRRRSLTARFFVATKYARGHRPCLHCYVEVGCKDAAFAIPADVRTGGIAHTVREELRFDSVGARNASHCRSTD